VLLAEEPALARGAEGAGAILERACLACRPLGLGGRTRRLGPPGNLVGPLDLVALRLELVRLFA